MALFRSSPGSDPLDVHPTSCVELREVWGDTTLSSPWEYNMQHFMKCIQLSWSHFGKLKNQL